MTEIVRVPFHGEDILTVDVDGKPHVVLKPAIEAIGLDYWSQVEKLRGKSWARTRLVPVRDSAGRMQESVVVDVRTFLMLLATVDERRVAADVAPKLVTYQAEVADAIEAYWTEGAAMNPRAEVAQPASQLDVLAAAVAELQRVEREAAKALTVAAEASETTRVTAARLDAIEGKHDWFAALGYARLNGWRTDVQWLQKLGRQAGRIGRAAGLPTNKVQHGLYGQVAQWPAWCWDRAYEALCGENGA